MSAPYLYNHNSNTYLMNIDNSDAINPMNGVNTATSNSNDNNNTMDGLQEQIRQLQEQLSDKEDVNFELSATVLAVQAETDYKIQQIQQDTDKQVRHLQEQIRLLQNESNLLLSSSRPPPNVMNHRRNDENNPKNNPNNRQQHPLQQRLVGGPMLLCSQDENNDDTIISSVPQHHGIQNHDIDSRMMDDDPPSADPYAAATTSRPREEYGLTTRNESIHTSSSGLVPFLLQKAILRKPTIPIIIMAAPSTNNELDDGSSDSHRTSTDDNTIHVNFYNNNNKVASRLTQMVATTISSTTTNESNRISDVQIVLYLVEQCLTMEHSHVEATAIIAGQDQQQQEIQKTHQQQHSRMDQECLIVLLDWLFDAFMYSPDSCQFIYDAVATSSSTSARQRKQPRRRTGIRIIQQHSNEKSKYISTTAFLDRIDKELKNPFWTPLQSSYKNNVRTESIVPSELQSSYCQRFIQTVLYKSIQLPFITMNNNKRVMQRITTDSNSNILLDYILSQNAIKVTRILMKGRSNVFVPVLIKEEIDLTNLIHSWHIAARRILLSYSPQQQQHRPQQQQRRQHPATNTKTSNFRGGGTSSVHPGRIPYRLVPPLEGIETDTGELEYDTSIDTNEVTKKKNKSSIVNHGSNDSFSNRRANVDLSWFSSTLCLLVDIMMASAKSNPTEKDSLNTNKVSRGTWLHSSLYETIESEWRFRCLQGSVVDVLEHIIIPNENLHMHPLAYACIGWFETHLTTSNQATIALELLCTQQATSKSTADMWHRGVTAIGVTIQFLHVIVIRQLMKDHEPASNEYEMGIRLCPIRDRIIRFLHNVLLVVQEDRKRWDKQQQQKQEDNENETTNSAAKTAKSSSSSTTITPMSFLTVVSEYKELYTSSAAVLLHNGAASPSIIGVKVHPDIRSMLQLQMDELVMDQEELDVVTSRGTMS